jgi:nitrogen regulatory protein PII-like uncharacterized protein
MIIANSKLSPINSKTYILTWVYMGIKKNTDHWEAFDSYEDANKKYNFLLNKHADMITISNVVKSTDYDSIVNLISHDGVVIKDIKN